MSGTTIEATVRPGSVVAAELAALRGQLDATLEVRVQEALGHRAAPAARTTGKRTRSVADARTTGAHTGRAGTPVVRTVNASPEAVRRELTAQDERVVNERAKELVFERMIQRLPAGTVVRDTAVDPSGTRVAHIDVAGGGDVTLVVDAQGRADLVMERCELTELVTAQGAVAGCEAEAELGRRFHESWRDNELDVDADDIVEGDGGQQAMGAGS